MLLQCESEHAYALSVYIHVWLFYAMFHYSSHLQLNLNSICLYMCIDMNAFVHACVYMYVHIHNVHNATKTVSVHAYLY